MLEKMVALLNATTSPTERLESTISTSRPAAIDIQLKLYNVFLPVVAVLIIGLNLPIVVSSGLILHRGQQPRSTYLFLGNVALSDLLIGVALLFGQFYPVALRHEMTCCIQMGMTVSAMLVSVYSVMLIGIDRYLYILYGLQHQRYIYSNRARLMVFMTWVLGVIVGFLPAMGLRNDTDNGRLCWFIILTPPYLVLITTTIGLIPLVVIIVLYSIILRQALKKITELKKAAEYSKGIERGNLRLFRGGGGGGSGVGGGEQIPRDSTLSVVDEVIQQYKEEEQKQPFKRKSKLLNWLKRSQKENIKIAPVYNPSKWKAIKVVLYTTGSFFATWFPFFVASAMFALCNPQRTPVFCDNIRVALTSPLTILGLTNSLLNPIVYAWWHNGFRESVRKIYHGIVGGRHRRDLNEVPRQRSTTTSNVLSTPQSNSELETSDLEQRIIQHKVGVGVDHRQVRNSNRTDETEVSLQREDNGRR